MRRISIPVLSVALLMAVSAPVLAQENNNPTTQCASATAAQCNEVVQDFSTDPGYTMDGFTYYAPGDNLRATTAVSTNYSFTTPSFYVTSFGNLSVGFTVATSGGANNVFASGNTLPLTINILNQDGTVIATCNSFSITAAGQYCFTIGDADLLTGGMVSYQFVFNSGTQDGILDIDNLAVASNQQAPLPVKFGQFTARPVASGIQLNWTIDAEENTSGYSVERSADGRTYTSIGNISATGARSYSYTDTKPLAEGFYRIKAIDLDGKFGYSNVLRLRGTESSVVVRGFLSNPNQLTIQHDAAEQGSKVMVTTADGKLIKAVSVIAGAQQTFVDVSAARAGLLIVRFETAKGQAETMKIVKQ